MEARSSGSYGFESWVKVLYVCRPYTWLLILLVVYTSDHDHISLVPGKPRYGQQFSACGVGTSDSDFIFKQPSDASHAPALVTTCSQFLASPMSHAAKAKAKGVSATSFFDLKAELSKQEAEFAKNKAAGGNTQIVGGLKKPDKVSRLSA